MTAKAPLIDLAGVELARTIRRPRFGRALSAGDGALAEALADLDEPRRWHLTHPGCHRR